MNTKTYEPVPPLTVKDARIAVAAFFKNIGVKP